MRMMLEKWDIRCLYRCSGGWRRRWVAAIKRWWPEEDSAGVFCGPLHDWRFKGTGYINLCILASDGELAVIVKEVGGGNVVL